MTRADVALVERGLAPSRSAAQRLIADGAVFVVPSLRIERASQRISESDRLQVTGSDETRYVSRAGAKLAHALRDFGLDPAGLQVLDVGMSTGGFSDCLLQHGARGVVGIEVGHGQLHPRLAADPRVQCVERLNAREATLERLGRTVRGLPEHGFGFAVVDLSFISLTKVLPALDGLLAPSATAVLLVKPQFELSSAELDGRGIVSDPRHRLLAVDRVAQACTALGWTVLARSDSAVPGTDGNRECFLHAHAPAARKQDRRNP